MTIIRLCFELITALSVPECMYYVVSRFNVHMNTKKKAKLISYENEKE